MGDVWRQISEYPKDHFPRLLWAEETGMVVGFLDISWNWWPCPAKEPLSNPPTHWMELPTQPWPEKGEKR